MYGNTVNKAELSEVAREFLCLLEKHQVNHQSAKNVLNRSRSLIEKAINGEIDTPMPKGFFPEEFWEDSDLFQYRDLGDAVAKFSLLLEGAESLDQVKKTVQDIERQAEKDEQELRDRLKR
jgi:hypothetical protein